MCELVLNGKAPELGLRNFDVLIKVTKLHRRQVLWADGFAQGAEIIVGYRGVAACIFRRTSIADHGAARRIEAGVISYVAKVALITDAVAAADAVAAIAEDVIGEADARCKGSPA